MIINLVVFHFFNSFAGHGSLADWFIIFFAEWFPWLVVLSTIIYLFWHHDKIKSKGKKKGLKMKEVSAFFLTSGLAWGVTILLKYIFSSPRPFISVLDAHVLLSYVGFDSFPSGHATFFAALATSVYLFHKKSGRVLYVCALIIGVARIMAGLHFPIDIISGYVIGIIIATVAHKLIIKNNIK